MFTRTHLVMLAFAIVFLLFAIIGCAHQPRPLEVQIPESIGGPVAQAISRLTGMRPKAFTLPGVAVYFRTPDACTRAHEAVHLEDMAAMGADAWFLEWGGQLVECGGWTPERAAFGSCLSSIELERRAYAVEADCREGMSK